MTDELEVALERDAETLAGDAEGAERDLVLEGVREAARRARAGQLDAAAANLDEVRRRLVARDHFRRFDNDIWVFLDVLRQVRALSGGAASAAFDRLQAAAPRMDRDLTPEQRAFWYGDPTAQVGGRIVALGPGDAPDGPDPRVAPAEPRLTLPQSLGLCAIGLALLGLAWHLGRAGGSLALIVGAAGGLLALAPLAALDRSPP